MFKPADHDAAAQWPASLETVAVSLAQASNPCAIFWGDELFLWHNQPWQEAAGDFAEQGRPYRDALADNVVGALRNAQNGNPQSATVSSALLLKPTIVEQSDEHLVVISPLPEAQSGEVKAVLVQLFPKPNGQWPGQRTPLGRAHDAPRDSQPQELALDEHPFFHKFAEMLPMGLAILDHKAEAVFVNKCFHELTTHPEKNRTFKAWPNSIHPDDYERVIESYHAAFESQTQLRTEYRATTEGKTFWRLLLLTPLEEDNLRHVSLKKHGGFICCIVDITSEKSAEMAERNAAKDAREHKEQQERFIDMISHEIRNPLSAILHCAEDILEIVGNSNLANDAQASLVDAAETIILCTTHQRHIVDDVLSFSKLDSSMLALSPRSTQPKPSVARTLRMFQPEIRKYDLELDYKVDVSYHDNGLDWVMADLQRISQVIINLLSNAIKFTSRKTGEKKILVAMGASIERPTSYPPNVVFFDPDDTSHRLDGTRTNEWGNGEAVYIMVAIVDTGIGISDVDQKKLFQRFRQATPKTEEVYGGSGLGLNISRKLCQLHGGDIGVSSEEGKGSTFGFFFKVRRSEEPNGDGTGADDERETEALTQQIAKLGHHPSKKVDRAHMPENLKHPEVTHVASATPEAVTDKRYQRTAQIAAEVTTPLKERDQYAEEEDFGASSLPDQRPFSSESAPHDHPPSPDGRSSGSIGDTSHSNTMIAPHEETAAAPDKPGPSAGSKSNRILLVEDNLINQKILFRKLTTKGFQVTTANNGLEAVTAVKNMALPDADSGRKGEFDCILMDQEMPVMDGNEASREIRTLEADGIIPHVPILGVTANVRSEQREEMLQAGMDDVIHKPYRIEEIIAKISGLTK